MAIVGDQAGSSFRFTDVQVNMFATLKRTVVHAQAAAGLLTTIATAGQQQAKDNQTQARVPNPLGVPERDGLGMAMER